MSLPTKKNIFFFLLSLGLLLLFLLSETYLGLYVVAGLSLLLLLFRNLFPEKEALSFPIVVLILLLLFSFGLSILSSVSFSHSIYSFLRYTFLFTSFLFFYKADFSTSDIRAILRILLIQGVTLVFVATFFFVFPEYGNKIPGMNLIFSTYGHNHLGAVMLLLAPISFWFFLSENNQAYFWLFAVFCAAIVFSFGRTVIFIGLLQLFCLFFLYRRQQRKPLSSRLKVFVFSLGVIFLSSLTLYFHSAKYGLCLFGDVAYEEKLCKTELGRNVRYFYWLQGWEAFLAKPILGYGIGTFGIASSMYRQIPEYQSAYAHNDYLQIFAEGGIISGIIFLTLLFLLYQGSGRMFFDFRAMFLPLSLFSIGIDIFFDFDFHFLSIAFLVLLLFALITGVSSKPERQFPVSRLRPIFAGLLIIVLIGCSVYMVTDTLVALEKDAAAYRIFPYFHWHALNFMKSEEVSFDQKQRLAQVSWANKTVQSQWVELLEGKQKAAAELASWKSDPWRRTSSFLPKYYYDEQDFQSLEKTMLDIKNFLDEKRDKYGFQKESLPSLQKDQWAAYFVELASHNFRQKKYLEAAEYLSSAHYFNEWSLGPTIAFFTDFKVEDFDPKMRLFLQEIAEIPIEHFGDNRVQLAQMYYAQTAYLLETGEDDAAIHQSTVDAITSSEASAQWFQQHIFDSLDSHFWQRFIDNQDWDGFYRHALVFHAIQNHEYQPDSYYDYGHYEVLTRYLLAPLQRYVDFQVNQGSFEKVGHFLDAVIPGMLRTGGVYWWQAQRGYWYGMKGDDVRAQQAFRECLQENPGHEDCQHGLQNLLEKGYPDVVRYYEIREILLEL